ncbi:MAG TPA: hypothetical protein RMH85_34450 [Polyangiaceae bacterium LLY-WYZ-15_(1-7)]|nr:hypothetical protein [Sandaracinus sp.]HJK89891.1 hypothetical protein [Polyangiaceae bacterium LLY-WYZ-15_(1-7)]MBJ72695.1 hypothetical protein [Sandaracinus sp.]HJL02975.1 hypothetical protein [Polyangiaceae bacterium LLY-WYZ-15_(1-7)]HJL13637.1 hypothetical protein [Polyangiaceae bacterium LLY-WYZ-15_(1-7)]
MSARSELLALCGLALVAAACNDTAVLEGELVFPAEMGTPWVNVQVQRSSAPFTDDWGGGTNLAPHRLASGDTVYRFSLETQEPDADVHLRLRGCLEPDCSAVLGDGNPDPQSEIRFVLESPFYVQTRDPAPTRWRATIDALPRCVSCTEGSCPGGFTCREGACYDADGICLGTEPSLAIPQTSCRRVEPARVGEQLDAADPTWECVVDACGIAGCFDGDAPGGYCNASGVHFCAE